MLGICYGDDFLKCDDNNSTPFVWHKPLKYTHLDNFENRRGYFWEKLGSVTLLAKIKKN
jgi:hypothetical protein